MRFLIFLLLISCNPVENEQKLSLIRTKNLHHFPSASAIEFHDNRLFIFGDDSPYILILDTAYKGIDSLTIIDSKENRISKGAKIDIEAATILNFQNIDYLLAVSSFSTPARSKLFLSRLPVINNIVSLNYADVHARLKALGINEVNIEGAAFVKGKFIFSNRGNIINRDNFLIVADFNEDWTVKSVKAISIELPEQKNILGISGLAYSAAKDQLYLTASIEETSNSIADGKIGDSYLGRIDSFWNNLVKSSIKPDELHNISSLFKLRGDNKVESVAIESINKKEVILHLAADNDDGQSILYKVSWRNN